MAKVRFAMIGTGWRASFFTRLARLCPDQFSVGPIYTRDPENAQKLRQETGLSYTSNLEEIYASGCDFVILCVKRGYCRPYLDALAAHHLPVLCETPPAETVEALQDLYQAHKNARFQFVEQYFCQPLYAAWLKAVQAGLIGEVESVSLSALHGYHAASMLRLLLGTDQQAFTLKADSSTEHVVETKNRQGDVRDGTLTAYERARAKITFASGKVAYYDFSGPQYQSYLRQRHINIRGTRGEIDDMLLEQLNGDGTAVAMPLVRCDLGRFDNKFHGLHTLSVGDKVLYENPFQYAPLNDDEIALASLLVLMKRYVDTGEDFYPLKQVLQDTYLSLALETALKNGGSFTSAPQPWQEKDV